MISTKVTSDEQSKFISSCSDSTYISLTEVDKSVFLRPSTAISSPLVTPTAEFTDDYGKLIFNMFFNPTLKEQ